MYCTYNIVIFENMLDGMGEGEGLRYYFINIWSIWLVLYIFGKSFFLTFCPLLKARVHFVLFQFPLLYLNWNKCRLPAWNGTHHRLLVTICLNNCELTGTKWEYFLQQLSLLSEGNSTLSSLVVFLYFVFLFIIM